MSDLRCTFCNGELSVEMETRGAAYLTYEVAESIECFNWKCGAVWETNGKLRTEGKDRPRHDGSCEIPPSPGDDECGCALRAQILAEQEPLASQLCVCGHQRACHAGSPTTATGYCVPASCECPAFRLAEQSTEEEF